jgi:tetratricopeptide (TPR) repeat protein
MKTFYKSTINIIVGMAMMLILGLIVKAYGENNKEKVVYTDFKISNQDMQNILNFETYIKLNPNDAEIYKKRGYLYLKSGNYAEALMDFEKASAINQSDAFLYHLISETYKAMNMDHEAKVYQKIAQGILYKGIENLQPNEYKELKYTIQLGVFRGEPNKEFFRGLDKKKIKTEVNEIGHTVYSYGEYNSYAEANAMKQELLSKGKQGVFIKAYYNGKELAITKAIEKEKHISEQLAESAK